MTGTARARSARARTGTSRSACPCSPADETVSERVHGAYRSPGPPSSCSISRARYAPAIRSVSISSRLPAHAMRAGCVLSRATIGCTQSGRRWTGPARREEPCPPIAAAAPVPGSSLGVGRSVAWVLAAVGRGVADDFLGDLAYLAVLELRLLDQQVERGVG